MGNWGYYILLQLATSQEVHHKIKATTNALKGSKFHVCWINF